MSFTFLLFASYSLALWLLLPAEPGSPDSVRRLLARVSLSWPVIGLTCALFTLIDVVIDPVALRGDRWFLGQIYGYPDPGVYFGVPLANFGGWFVVGLIAMTGYRVLDRRCGMLPAFPHAVAAREVLLGCGLYLRRAVVQSGADVLDRRMAAGPGRVPALRARDRPGAFETAPFGLVLTLNSTSPCPSLQRRGTGRAWPSLHVLPPLCKGRIGGVEFLSLQRVHWSRTQPVPRYAPNQRLYETGVTGKMNVHVLSEWTHPPERLMKIAFPLSSKTKD